MQLGQDRAGGAHWLPCGVQPSGEGESFLQDFCMYTLKLATCLLACSLLKTHAPNPSLVHLLLLPRAGASTLAYARIQKIENELACMLAMSSVQSSVQAVVLC
eukprot:1157619-Pelagomonas_calceolata.AAC.21